MRLFLNLIIFLSVIPFVLIGLPLLYLLDRMENRGKDETLNWDWWKTDKKRS